MILTFSGCTNFDEKEKQVDTSEFIVSTSQTQNSSKTEDIDINKTTQKTTTTEETILPQATNIEKGSFWNNPILIKQEDGKIFSEDGKYEFKVTCNKSEIHVGDEFQISTELVSKDNTDFWGLGYLGKINVDSGGNYDYVDSCDTTESWYNFNNNSPFVRTFIATKSGTWNIDQSYEFSIDIDNKTIYYMSRDAIITPLEILK